MELKQEMLNSIILSVKPFYNDLIFKKQKIYEFRNYIPSNFNGYFWVYESTPSKKLLYIMKVSAPIVFPNKISGNSYGIERFNSGEMNNKYAYKIEKIYMLKEPIPLEKLKKLGFIAPQMYTYINKNSKLKDFLSGNIDLSVL